MQALRRQGVMGDEPRAMTNAERQSLYRERREIREPRRRYVNVQTSPIGRPARWELCVDTLKGLQQEYQDWYDNLPPSLQQDSPTARKLEAVINLDFSELEDIELPRGFGRDEERPRSRPACSASSH